MISLKDFMEVTNYRISEGSDYCWHCFGPHAYCLDSWNGDQNGHTISITFDTVTQEVYQAHAYDYANERAYRITNPAYKEDYRKEVQSRNQVDCAWEKDDGTPLEYVDLEVDEDFLAKAQAIVAGEVYDTRVSVPVEFTDQELLKYMKMAHERDITFNQLVEEALKQEIERLRAL